jgi:hypothetical protein
MVFLVAVDDADAALGDADLERTIRSLGNWCRPLPSIWLVSSPLLCTEAIKDELSPHLSPSRHLMVLPLHPNAVTDNENWALPEVQVWLTLNS